MAGYVYQHFLPVKISIKEQPTVFERFGVHWTPKLLLLDSEGIERHRVEGYLPVDDFLAQLHLGTAHAAFSHQVWTDAERWYREVFQKFPNTEAAPEALYWSGVSIYKASGNVAALPVTASQLRHRYSESSWTKKASVWL